MSRANNPTQFGHGSLLDKSTAHPGAVDMSIFEKKSGQNAKGRVGQGSVNSKYLQQCREDNPDSPPARNKASLKLSNCRINTPPDKLDIGKEFEVACQVDFINDYNPTNAKVIFVFTSKFEDSTEECKTTFSGIIDLNSKSQTITATGKLPAPQSSPPEGTKVPYFVTASHPEAELSAKSDEVNVLISSPSDDEGEHIADRSITITTENGSLLNGAQYVLCEDGKKVKQGMLNENSQLSYVAKPGFKYSIYLLNAGATEEVVDV